MAVIVGTMLMFILALVISAVVTYIVTKIPGETECI